MPTPTYDLIDSTVLSSSASSVTFSSIPATYRDLVVVWDVISASGSGTIQCENRFNADTGTNYNAVYMRGDGSTTNSSSSSATDELRLFTGASVTETVRGMFVLQIMDYSATDKHKTALARSGATNEYVTAAAGRWADTSAITSVLIQPTNPSASFGATSAFYLYGIVS